jgi:glyoxylate/hydroxypyruvate reductase
MLVFTNVPLQSWQRARLVGQLGGDDVHYGDPVQFTSAARDAFIRSEVAFGWCPPQLLAEAPRLRWLQLDSAGCEPYLDLDWRLLSQRITVTNLRGLFSVQVAETAVGGALALFRGLGQLAVLQHARTWRSEELREGLRTLSGASVLVIGEGAIGRAIKDRLAAFGCLVTTFGTQSSGADLVSMQQLDRALSAADLAFLSLPLTPSTRGVIDRRRLAMLAPSAVLVNVGRGGLIDEPALIEQLHAGRLGGAVLDVTDVEPLPAEHPLWSTPNVILTQHSAGGSDDEITRKLDIFLENLKLYRSRAPLRNVVDWAKGY